jgi:superfamily II DNA helicase RecQ
VRVHRTFLDRAHPPLLSGEGWRAWREGGHLNERTARRRSGQAKLRGVARYARARGCRRSVLLEWFGESSAVPQCAGCDRCVGWPVVLERALGH